jgi:hypothetical protein
VAAWTQGAGLTPESPLGALLGVKRWCGWHWRLAGKKWTKVPHARVNHPGEGVTYAQAVQEVAAGRADGVGWLTDGEDGLVWLDLDKCRDPVTGVIDEWAQDLLSCAPDVYVEVTPSGTGLRMVGRAGQLAEPTTRGRGEPVNKTLRIDGARPRAQIEIIYNSARYVTVTGHALSACPVDGADLGELAAKLWQEALAQKSDRKKENGAALPGEDRRAPIEDVVSALEAIHNGDGWDEGLTWDEWSRIGMAAWAASGGEPEGLEAWAAWSARCEDKHDDAACIERWEHWARSPPTELSFGTLAIEAGKATGGRWRRPSRQPAAEFKAEEGEGDDAGEGGGAGNGGSAGVGGGDAGGAGVRAAGQAGDLSPFMRLMGRVIYVKTLNRFFDTEDFTLMDEARLCIEAGKMGVEGFAAKGAKGVVAQLVGHPAGKLRHAYGMTLRPGQGVLVREPEGLCVNTWRPSTLVPSDGDASVWFNHVERLIPDAADRERVLDRLAFMAQHPGVKLNSALVFLGGQGLGKDLVLDPFWATVGEDNMRVLKGTDLGGNFDGHLTRAHLLISEMPSFRKRSYYDEIKGMVTTPPNHMRINLKGIPEYWIPNVLNIVVTTNHPDAIALAEDDRRFDVVQTVYAAGAEGNAYFERMFGWLAAGGNAAVAGALLRRDVATFKPKQAPPVSVAKAAMMREAEAPGMAWARALWGEDGPLGSRGLVTVDEVMELARRGTWGASPQIISHRLVKQILQALRADGWENTGVLVAQENSRVRPWTRMKPIELYRQTKPDALRERLEEDRRRCAGRGF